MPGKGKSPARMLRKESALLDGGTARRGGGRSRGKGVKGTEEGGRSHGASQLTFEDFGFYTEWIEQRN